MVGPRPRGLHGHRPGALDRLVLRAAGRAAADARRWEHPYVRRVVGYPEVVLDAAFWRLPGGSVLELIEYVARRGDGRHGDLQRRQRAPLPRHGDIHASSHGSRRSPRSATRRPWRSPGARTAAAGPATCATPTASRSSSCRCRRAARSWTRSPGDRHGRGAPGLREVAARAGISISTGVACAQRASRHRRGDAPAGGRGRARARLRAEPAGPRPALGGDAHHRLPGARPGQRRRGRDRPGRGGRAARGRPLRAADQLRGPVPSSTPSTCACWPRGASTACCCCWPTRAPGRPAPGWPACASRSWPSTASCRRSSAPPRCSWTTTAACARSRRTSPGSGTAASRSSARRRPSAPDACQPSALRAAGADLGLDVLVEEGPWTTEFGVEATARLLASPAPPTAILAGSNLTVFGVLRAVRAAGLRVPGEVSVLVSDDVPAFEFIDPPLTALSQDPGADRARGRPAPARPARRRRARDGAHPHAAGGARERRDRPTPPTEVRTREHDRGRAGLSPAVPRAQRPRPAALRDAGPGRDRRRRGGLGRVHLAVARLGGGRAHDRRGGAGAAAAGRGPARPAPAVGADARPDVLVRARRHRELRHQRAGLGDLGPRGTPRRPARAPAPRRRGARLVPRLRLDHLGPGRPRLDDARVRRLRRAGLHGRQGRLGLAIRPRASAPTAAATRPA